MKLTKFTSALMVAGMVLTIGTSVAMMPISAEARTVVVDDPSLLVVKITKQDLEQATGIKLTNESARKVYKELTKSCTWEYLGFSKSYAKLIATHFSTEAIPMLSYVEGLNTYKSYLSVDVTNARFVTIT